MSNKRFTQHGCPPYPGTPIRSRCRSRWAIRDAPLWESCVIVSRSMQKIGHPNHFDVGLGQPHGACWRIETRKGRYRVAVHFAGQVSRTGKVG